MQKLLIKGKKYLNGSIPISGSKNATLPILAASILANTTKLKNVPLVKDIFTMIDLLKFIGIKIKVSTKKKTIELVNKNKRINTLAPYKLVKTMRAGILVLGPLLTKYKKAKVSLPGGCAIGTRPVDLHLLALKKLGAKIKIKDGYIFAEAKKGLFGANIKFPSTSVGATENALIAAHGAKGKTILSNCAIEPEILDLISFLKKLGSKIKISGRKISIERQDMSKNKINHKIIFDRIEAGTYLVAGVLIGKKIILNKNIPKILKNEINILKKMGAKITYDNNSILIKHLSLAKEIILSVPNRFPIVYPRIHIVEGATTPWHCDACRSNLPQYFRILRKTGSGSKHSGLLMDTRISFGKSVFKSFNNSISIFCQKCTFIFS